MSETEFDRLRAENARLAAEVAAGEAALAAAAEERAKLEQLVSKLQHKVSELVRQLYGRKSEKIDPKQILLEFAAEEAKESASLPTPPHVDEAPDGESDSTQDQPEKKTKKKGKGHGWSRPPKDLPRTRIELKPTAAELECDCCGGQRTSIGSPEITERYDFEPRSVFIVETVRDRFRCPRCQDGTIIAPLPPPPLQTESRGRAEAGLLAHIVTSKYNDHLPLHRLHQVLVREGVHLSTSTLCDYVHGTAALLRPIAAQVLRGVLSRPVVGMDETGVRVVFDKNDPKDGTRNARIWVYRGLQGEVYFTVSATKAKADVDGPKTVLADFEGYVQADAAGVFDDLYADGKRIEVACRAHERRKYFEAKKANPQEAAFALEVFQRVYEIETRVREANSAARAMARQTETKPILDAFDGWIDALAASPALVPGTPLATAVGYSRNHRAALRRFLDDPRLSPDNNAVERSLRLVAVGRKNWLFAGSEEAAHDAATLYTLVASCRELEIDPWAYLREVIQRRAASPNDPVDKLTPREWAEARRAADAAKSAASQS